MFIMVYCKYKYGFLKSANHYTHFYLYFMQGSNFLGTEFVIKIFQIQSMVMYYVYVSLVLRGFGL